MFDIMSFVSFKFGMKVVGTYWVMIVSVCDGCDIGT